MKLKEIIITNKVNCINSIDYCRGLKQLVFNLAENFETPVSSCMSITFENVSNIIIEEGYGGPKDKITRISQTKENDKVRYIFKAKRRKIEFLTDAEPLMTGF
ncbi:MAG: hypothetical protein ACM3U0_02150 [archaeon]